MVHWSSDLYKYPSWIDILTYFTDRFTDVTVSVKAVRSYVTQNIFGPLEDRSWAYMLQNCVLPIQCTRESFRMFLAYPHTRPRLMPCSRHPCVMHHIIMMLCIMSSWCYVSYHASMGRMQRHPVLTV
jgi:hypothetical protein